MPEDTSNNAAKQATGRFLKTKGAAIGVAVGVALTSTGDYLLENSGLLSYVVGLIKQLLPFWPQ